MNHTRNTMVALSVACTMTDAEFQNLIIIRDYTRNLPVVTRQPHPFLTTRRTPTRSRSAEP
jgi:hypothetical protein